MDEVDKAVIATALKDMFRSNHFSICTIDKLQKLSGCYADPKTYQRMNALHCVHYSEMPQGMKDWLVLQCAEIFSQDALDVDRVIDTKLGFKQKVGLKLLNFN